MQEDRARQLIGQERERVERLVRDLRAGTDEPEGASFAELADYDQHPADQGTETFEREKDLSVLETLEAEITELDAALERVEHGSYGICEACHEPIPEARLEARPTARFCVDHEPQR